ncbi:Hypothetical predicted protein [Octopus vulgaris]|uniref:Uncharacterized protein n=1 Tax=Octopus vulgaris TaxID=6645 RepID=A0AA36AP82_OCTVU|nr:Hypothetical predicted protein [Octopus vulgaris]
MFLETKRKTKSLYQIACPMVNLEARPPGKSQPGLEKSSTGTNSYGHGWSLEREIPQLEPSKFTTTTTTERKKCKRNKRTREAYKEVIYAYYNALGRPSQERHTASSYSIWRTRNQDNRAYVDENKLANVGRDIFRNNRLTDSKISAIKHATENDINIRHKGNEESDEQYSPPRGFIERLPSDQSTQRSEDTRNSIEPVKDSQENDKTTVTEDLAFAEEHRESMAEMRQKILNTLEVVRQKNYTYTYISNCGDINLLRRRKILSKYYQFHTDKVNSRYDRVHTLSWKILFLRKFSHFLSTKHGAMDLPLPQCNMLLETCWKEFTVFVDLEALRKRSYNIPNLN